MMDFGDMSAGSLNRAEDHEEGEEMMTTDPIPYSVSLAELEEMPTLAEGQADDLKIDTGTERVWLSRCTVEDGEPYNNRVTVERLIDGRWEEVEYFQAI